MIKLIIWDLLGVLYENGEVNPFARAILAEFEKKSIENVCVSNLSPDTVHRLAEQLNIKHVIICQEEGFSKKETPVYEKVLSDFKVKANEVLFIDDNESNLAAARKIGIKTAVFRGKKGNADFAIDDLVDVWGILAHIMDHACPPTCPP
ncbi:MAG TPA: HAD-IA family hydrolase [Candidatus Bipolaricaulota bacterium]|nr:HAD-IA family hydrolase [Candidatus Bipolaricaulota bacterium]